MPLQQAVARIWEAVLQVSPIGATDNYFDLGGDSIRALQIFARIKQLTGREFPLSLMIEAPTVVQLTDALQRQMVSIERTLVLLKPGVTAMPLFIVHGLGGSVMELRDLARSLRTDRAVYGLQARGFVQGSQPHQRIEDLAAEYLAAIRSVQPGGPYLLAGYSFGGLVAFEMAHQMIDHGDEIERLMLLDTTLHETHWPAAAWAEYLWRRSRHALGALRRQKLDQLGSFGLGLWQSLRQRIGRKRRRHGHALEHVNGVAELPETVRNIYRAHYAAMLAYRPRPTVLPITLFRSQLEASHLCDPKTIWRRLSPAVTAYDVAGDHESMIRPPHLTRLAEAWSACLKGPASWLDTGALRSPQRAAARES